MYPGFIPHWKRRHCRSDYAADPEGRGGYGERSWRSRWEYSLSPEEDAAGLGFGSGAFGVRRPLRFLAYKLGLNEPQVAELAKILNDLKTERAQAAVDHRRTVASFADAIAGEAFDAAKANEGGTLRVKSAEKLRDAVVAALGRIHALLDPRQRGELAYLIRTGTLSI